MNASAPELAHHAISGGIANRDAAELLCHLGRPASFPVFPALAAMIWSGPLDAPESLPAGSHNSVDVRGGPWHLNSGLGRPIPAVSLVARDA